MITSYINTEQIVLKNIFELCVYDELLYALNPSAKLSVLFYRIIFSNAVFECLRVEKMKSELNFIRLLLSKCTMKMTA